MASTIKITPSIPDLKHFEEGLVSQIETIKFRKVNNNFQRVLRSDVNEILVTDDKRNNNYKLSREQYEI